MRKEINAPVLLRYKAKDESNKCKKLPKNISINDYDTHHRNEQYAIINVIQYISLDKVQNINYKNAKIK